ncbi:uncharacterized protein [Dendropsophus ebraccatus]|uniref:uncharacterized protein isoform X1 n=1 Tax=Dendropsophus ebraccatus TaxID=150705 RepID=UPI0038321015
MDQGTPTSTVEESGIQAVFQELSAVVLFDEDQNTEHESREINNMDQAIATVTTEDSDIEAAFQDLSAVLLCEDNQNTEEGASENLEGQSQLQNSTDEFRELTARLRSKYSGEARHAPCFPENPFRDSNSHYLEFSEPIILTRVGTVDWCMCSHCVVMSTNIESICCSEIENVQPYVSNLRCITQHEFFNFYCHQPETVEINMRLVGEVQRQPSRKTINRLVNRYSLEKKI